MSVDSPAERAPVDPYDRHRFIRDLPVLDIVERLCEADRVIDVLLATGLRHHEIKKVLERSPVHLPRRLGDFRRFRVEISHNAVQLQQFIEKSAKLKAALEEIERDFNAGLVKPWEDEQ